jgi:hypothetical protein
LFPTPVQDGNLPAAIEARRLALPEALVEPHGLLQVRHSAEDEAWA